MVVAANYTVISSSFPTVSEPTAFYLALFLLLDIMSGNIIASRLASCMISMRASAPSRGSVSGAFLRGVHSLLFRLSPLQTHWRSPVYTAIAGHVLTSLL